MIDLYTVLNLQIAAGVAFGLTLWVSRRPLLRWSINHDFFLQAVLGLVADGDMERARKLTNAAASAPVAVIARAFLQEGRAAAETRHQEFLGQLGSQRLKVAAAGIIDLGVAAVCAHAITLGIVFWPVIGAVGFSLLLIAVTWRSMNRTERACEHALREWTISRRKR